MKIFEDRKIRIDLPTLIDSRMLLCANSGGGKSYTIRKILEEVGSEVMSIVLDVEGEFKTLREKYDFLLIGQTGDVPINIKAAHLLPQKLMELNVSSVIDISDLKMHDRVLYVKKFLEALMELPRKFWKPCLVVVDEAHAYCGQQEKQDSTRAVIDLMTRGRKRGYCGILATQRIAKLHKDAAAEANNYMVGRTGLDVDMKRASEILGFTSKTDMLSLRNLGAGEFFVFGTALSRSVEKAKVAKVKTTHPKVGMDLRNKITPPTQKIKAMLSKLADLPKEAEQKAKTIKELKHRNRELERELKGLPTARIDENQLKLAEKRGFDEANKQLYRQVANLNKQTQNLNGKLEKIAAIANVTVPLPIIKQPKPITKRTPAKNTLSFHRPAHVADIYDNETSLGRCERSILSLLYNNPHREFSKVLIGLFAGYSHKSGGFNNALSRLNSFSLIQRSGGNIIISQQGELDAPELLGDDIGLHETFTIDNWARKLPKCSSVIFQFLMQNPEVDFSKEEIGDNTGYQPGSGGFNNSLSKLNALGLIKRENGRIKLNTEMLEL